MSGATILLAGGGTGGHIFPNIAIAERVATLRPDLRVHFAVSARPGDAATMDRAGYPYTASEVRPLPPLSRPWRAPGFVVAWHRAKSSTRALLARGRIAAVVATGGFVSGPAIVCAARAGIPRALVNLDAIPGKANQRLVRMCPVVFSVYPSDHLPKAVPIGLPLRRESVASEAAPAARAALELALDPKLPLLYVTGATHGAESIVRMMIRWCESGGARAALAGWQVLHQCGRFDPTVLERAYRAAGVRATVVPRIGQMGLSFRAADLVVARAGAGTVAEAWANAAPTVFLPNPYHVDEHQRHNAQPLVTAGGAIVVRDHVDPAQNLALVVPKIAELVGSDERRAAMRAACEAAPPPDGAATVAEWIAEAVPA